MAEANPVGLRSHDAPDTSTEYVKVFVVPTDQAKFVDHEANEHAVRLEMFQHGLRPTGDISHRSAKDKPSAGSTSITYRVDAVLTADEEDPEVVHQDVAGNVPPVPGQDDEPEDETPEDDGQGGDPLDPETPPAS